ncbi:hypothetical protein, partial [Streptomyces sp. L-9-10]|uniref:hypothetical protein n=1 Tax=Streptomyces sp. L-9-10 TaxID=1478131 RepID=UPI001F0224AD
MDLLDWHRGRLSARRLAVLIEHMPRDSAISHALHGDAAEWTVTDYLLAAAVDHLAAANWMFASVNTDEKARSRRTRRKRWSSCCGRCGSGTRHWPRTPVMS